LGQAYSAALASLGRQARIVDGSATAFAGLAYLYRQFDGREIE